jgi:AraC family ethanolamine operon transcriptional activator
LNPKTISAAFDPDRTSGRAVQPPLEQQSIGISTLRSTDPDAFVGTLPGVRRRFLPIARDFEFFQIVVELGCVRLVVAQRPPCISEGHLEQALFGFGLPIGEARGLKVDGLQLDQSAVMIHGSAAPYRVFQPRRLTFASVFLPGGARERGWLECPRTTTARRAQPAAFQQLQAIIGDIVGHALRQACPSLHQNVAAGMRQSMFEAIDLAFATAPPEMPSGLAIGRYLRICRRAEEFINGTEKIPSGTDVAAAAGVTVRTLHNAMVAVNGMSLQKFMILNRLWAVRTALMSAGPEGLVKAIALDHGFWHLGRFSRTYRAFFGESPSHTLEHAKPRHDGL